MNWRTHTNPLKATALLTLALSLALSGTTRATVLTPESGDHLSLVLGDNESPYYKLVVDSSTFVTATGPGDLTFLVRFSMPATAGLKASWTIAVSEGSGPATTFDTSTVASDATWSDSPLRPGEACKVIVNVPEGTHRYQVRLASSIKSFAGVRYLFSNGTSHSAKSAVYPIDMLGATSVEIKEKVIDFFLADSTRAVKVKVIGPTNLRIVTRLAYSGVMKGPQKYSAVVGLDSTPVVRNALETSKSPATYFTNHKEWSVGESRTIYVDIPDGSHVVSVRLGSSLAPALALRFTIPKEDIGK